MSVNGPLARTLEEVIFYSKTIINQQPWLRDPKCLPIPWRPVERKKYLKLAVFWNDGIVTPTPPVARALSETVSKLRAAGHEIVEWDPAENEEANSLLRQLFVADGAKSIRGLLEPTNEPFRPEMQSYEDSVERGVHEMWKIQATRSELQKRYLDRWQAIEGLDGLICMFLSLLCYYHYYQQFCVLRNVISQARSLLGALPSMASLSTADTLVFITSLITRLPPFHAASMPMPRLMQHTVAIAH